MGESWKPFPWALIIISVVIIAATTVGIVEIVRHL